MEDVYGRALLDYMEGRGEAVMLYNSYGLPEEMPMEVFFRTADDMPELEIRAMDMCSGKVLDIGAGAGAHVLELQERGYDVTAVEISPGACEVMRRLGVQKVVQGDIYKHAGRYNTLLMLMNGIGLVGTLGGLRRFLKYAKGLLLAGGCIIMDSSDINYLYTLQGKPRDRYYGEIDFEYEYRGQRGGWFKWLYVDYDSLLVAAIECGYVCRKVYEDGNDQYLAVLRVREK